MTTPTASIVMFLIASAAGALGQYLYKSGADRADGTVLGYLVNPRLLGGVICYVAVMVLFVAAFKKGGSLTVLYPIYATTFIWAALIALMAYGTPIRPVNVAGMLLLIGGMYLMGRGS
jgi:multidrug transporter EmrE-like cation transporter